MERILRMVRPSNFKVQVRQALSALPAVPQEIAFLQTNGGSQVDPVRERPPFPVCFSQAGFNGRGKAVEVGID